MFEEWIVINANIHVQNIFIFINQIHLCRGDIGLKGGEMYIQCLENKHFFWEMYIYALLSSTQTIICGKG